MRLENLYKNFATSTLEEQAAYIAAYRLRRAEDMAKSTTLPRTKSVKGSKFDLSDEEKAVMKMLGLKMKDVIALRESVEVEEEEVDEDILTEGDFEEEE